MFTQSLKEKLLNHIQDPIKSPLEQFMEISYVKPSGADTGFSAPKKTIPYVNPQNYYDGQQVNFSAVSKWMYHNPLRTPEFSIFDDIFALRFLFIAMILYVIFIKFFNSNYEANEKNFYSEKVFGFLLITFSLLTLYFKKLGLHFGGFLYRTMPVYKTFDEPVNGLYYKTEFRPYLHYRADFYTYPELNANLLDIFSSICLSMMVLIVFTWFVFISEGISSVYAGGPTVLTNNRIFHFKRGFYYLTTEILGEVVKYQKATQPHLPLLYGLFSFLFFANLLGMIPYSFTLTSHLVNTLVLSLTVLVMIFISTIARMGLHTFLSNMMPPGTPLILGFLLIPIEIISYFFRVLSLSVRLFANIMAGHTLLKVILGFAWTMLLISENLFFLNIVSMSTLVLLTVLELGVACIQAYVFTMLTCLYLNDAFNAH